MHRGSHNITNSCTLAYTLGQLVIQLVLLLRSVA